MIGRAAALLVAGAVVAGGAAVSARREPSTAAVDAPAAATVDGADLFRAKGCASCHQGPGSDSGFGAGPNLSDASSWAGDRIDGVDARAYLAQSILDPPAFISPAAFPSGGRMPVIAVGPGEVEALVAHLLER